MNAARKTAGFTVIELLVAVTIMAILISLLMTAIQQSREVARRVACQSNLRQWALALQDYASAHHGYLRGAAKASVIPPFPLAAPTIGSMHCRRSCASSR